MSERKGPRGFETFYSSIYGERWPALREALLARVRQVARPNAFAAGAAGVAGLAGRLDVDVAGAGAPFVDVDVDVGESGPQNANANVNVNVNVKLQTFAGQRALLLDGRFQPTPTTNGLTDFYVMDPASIFPAVALDVREGDEVADFCAAPGGKSLILAERKPSRLVVNELSDTRRGRLKAVMHDYLPPGFPVKVTGHDATRWCLYEQDAYDRILLDAPCSGERHLLANEEELKAWSPARSKNLAVRQYALLASALATVKPGGRIVYSTCSLSNLENDNVIARLLKKRAGEARVVKTAFEIGEKTEHGWMILPDTTGFGPIYFAILERVSD